MSTQKLFIVKKYYSFRPFFAGHMERVWSLHTNRGLWREILQLSSHLAPGEQAQTQVTLRLNLKRWCSATAPVSYPTSLRNFPNGCQGHPRSYPPPDRPSFTKPDPNSVRTRLQILFNYGIGWQKMHKRVEAWKQKKIHINHMYTFHIFI
jgi:hypothetical protein